MTDIASTLQSVRQIAQQLTENSLVLTIPNPEYPLAQYANEFTVDAQPTNTEVTEEMMVSTEEFIEEANAEPFPPSADAQADLSTLTKAGLAKVQYNCDNIICPAIEAMTRDFNERQKASCAADVRADVFTYKAIHDLPELVQHLSNYASHPVKQQYRTFMLPGQTTEQIIELATIANPHVGREQGTEWALTMPPEEISQVWNDLFGTSRVVEPREISFINGTRVPFSIDQLTLGYFLAARLAEDPMDVLGESVDHDSWVATMRVLHEMLGYYLLRAHQLRARHREDGTLILFSDAYNPIENRRLVVTLNGDVSKQWVRDGGDIQVALGAALMRPGQQNCANIEERATECLAKFRSVYPLIQQSAMDWSNRCRNQDFIDAFVSQSSKDLIGAMSQTDIRAAAKDGLRKLTQLELQNEFITFGRLITMIYYPEAIYWRYLEEYDQMGRNFPDASKRELATQALITLYCIWAAQQITVERYKPYVQEAPAAMEEPTGEEAETAIGEAVEGEGSLAEEPEVQEDETEVEEAAELDADHEQV